MLGKIFGVLCLVSFIFAAFSGKMSLLSAAVIDGAQGAVTLTISLLGMMCLWCGVMNVFKSIGLINKLAKLLSPILKFLFPTAYRTGNGAGEIAAAVSANFLGIGNAATPLAIKAMEAMAKDNRESDKASDDMVVFTVLGTASIDFFPATLIALRRAADSANPFEIIVPVWIVSTSCAIVAVLFAKGFCLWNSSRI